MFKRMVVLLCIYLAAFSAGCGSDQTKYIEIEVERENAQPVANAGDSTVGLTGETFYLMATASQDPDGDILSYLWSMGQRPSGSSADIANIYATETTFVPDLPGEYTISLVVHDGRVYSDPATATSGGSGLTNGYSDAEIAG